MKREIWLTSLVAFVAAVQLLSVVADAEAGRRGRRCRGGGCGGGYSGGNYGGGYGGGCYGGSCQTGGGYGQGHAAYGYDNGAGGQAQWQGGAPDEGYWSNGRWYSRGPQYGRRPGQAATPNPRRHESGFRGPNGNRPGPIDESIQPDDRGNAPRSQPEAIDRERRVDPSQPADNLERRPDADPTLTPETDATDRTGADRTGAEQVPTTESPEAPATVPQGT